MSVGGGRVRVMTQSPAAMRSSSVVTVIVKAVALPLKRNR